MSLGRLLAALICGAILAASVTAATTALIIGAHAALAPLVGDAFAWAILLALLAGGLAGAGLGASRALEPKRPRPSSGRPDPGEAAARRFVRDRPLVAMAVAALGVLLATRSPTYLGAAARAFLVRRRPTRT